MTMGRGLLCLAALATAGAGLARDDPGHDAKGGAARSDPGMKLASVMESTRRRLAAAAPLLDLDALRKARAGQPSAELFVARSWYVAPPSPPPAPPSQPVPAKPLAPPLPFVFMGRMQQGERMSVFLVKGDRVHVVSEGDVIDATYRLEKIEPGRLTLLYLPLRIAQTLAVEDGE